MPKSTLQQLADFGQSVWLDYINRPMLENGELKRRIDLGLRGMTSNPSIFNDAIGMSHDYDDSIVKLKGSGKSTFEIYDALTIADIQKAADIFKDVFEKTQKLDGYVSLEINPLLANKVEEQIEEGRRLFKKVNRANVMIKVPSTPQGFKVFEALIAEGINVNVTLIFSLEQYVQTVEAYLKGLKKRASSGGDLRNIRSVASVFVSRVDALIDKQLEQKIQEASDEALKIHLSSLAGKAAVANCRIIYHKYQELFESKEFQALQSQGANLQRVLWGSTSTKNPGYSDIKYVSELIAKDTVNTIPEKTLNAFLDHGEVKNAFGYDVKKAQGVIADLQSHRIDIREVCDKLLKDGCEAFNKSFDELLASIEKKAKQLIAK